MAAIILHARSFVSRKVHSLRRNLVADLELAADLDERYLVQPVLKAMQVLQLICEAAEPLTLNQLVREAGLPKTTVFRYLRTLTTIGFIEHDAETDRYHPGLGLWRLSHANGPYETLKRVCKPYMKRLQQRFNETINLGVLSGGEVFYLDMVESERSLRMQSSIGATDQLHSTSLGKVFLAFCATGRRESLIPRSLARRTENTITDRAELLDQLEIIRTTGYAIEVGENEEGSYCIAAPICDAGNVAIAAMSLSAPISRYEESARQAICAGLIAATGEIGRALRGEPAETRGGTKAVA
jgi:IclR family acetate operon transcriptional repressor